MAVAQNPLAIPGSNCAAAASGAETLSTCEFDSTSTDLCTVEAAPPPPKTLVQEIKSFVYNVCYIIAFTLLGIIIAALWVLSKIFEPLLEYLL